MQACVGRVEVLPVSGARLLEGIRNSIRLFGMSPSHHIIKKEMPIQLTDHMYIYIYIYLFTHTHVILYSVMSYFHRLYAHVDCVSNAEGLGTGVRFPAASRENM